MSRKNPFVSAVKSIDLSFEYEDGLPDQPFPEAGLKIATEMSGLYAEIISEAEYLDIQLFPSDFVVQNKTIKNWLEPVRVNAYCSAIQAVMSCLKRERAFALSSSGVLCIFDPFTAPIDKPITIGTMGVTLDHLTEICEEFSINLIQANKDNITLVLPGYYATMTRDNGRNWVATQVGTINQGE